MERPAWFWAAIGGAAALAAAGAFFFVRSQRIPPQAELLARLPYGDRVLVSLDVKALIGAGVLAGGANEDPEYKAFVADTGFDYRRDADRVLMSVGSDETYAWIAGRFDWGRLQRYTLSHGGLCQSGTCRVASPTPGRKIAFRRYAGSTLAFVSSTNTDAIQRMFEPPATLAPPEPPAAPVWFLLPHSALQTGEGMPTGTRMFASAISEANHAFVSIGRKGEAFEATLDALCGNEGQARIAVRELQGATTMLARMLVREHQQPNARDLSGILTRGEFHQDGLRVTGTWPVERAFVESLSLGAGSK